MNKRRASISLWLINLSSITAAIFTYIYLSTIAYQKSHSALIAQVILVAPMISGVLLYKLILRVSSSASPRTTLIRLNVAGAVSSITVYLCLGSGLYVALIGALAIGLIDGAQRVSRTMAIKGYFSTEDVAYALPLTLTAQFIAGAIAGAILSKYGNGVTPAVANLVVTSLFGIAALSAFSLPKVIDFAESGARLEKQSLGLFLKLLKADTALRHSFVWFLAVVSIFQGYFSATRVSLPLEVLKLPPPFVGHLQSLSALAALLAAVCFAGASRSGRVRGEWLVWVCSAVAGLAMIAASSSKLDVVTSFSLYFLYMFSWETLFFYWQANVIRKAPPGRIALVSTFQYLFSYLGITATGLLATLIGAAFGFTIAALSLFGIFLVVLRVNSSYRIQQ